MNVPSTRDIQAVVRERIVPAGSARHGLVVGIGQYRDPRLNLRCARADAEAVCRLMTDGDCGLFPPANVRLLLDAEATRENLWLELARLVRQAGPDDTVWIYYAGHGAVEGARSYWVTHNADVDNLRGTALDQRHLVEFLDDIPAQRLLVLLDCCHAAATAARRNATRATIAAEQVLGAFKGKGRLTLSSSDGREKSVELTHLGHGAFTHFLERGLRGEADLDGDGVVTADELWRFLEDKVQRASQEAGEPQTPVLIGEMTHDFALTLNPVATAEKKRVAEALIALAGWGEDKLPTEHVEFCLELLRFGARTPAERDLLAELDPLLTGALPAPTFRRLVVAARQAALAPGATPGAAAGAVAKPTPSTATPARRPPPLLRRWTESKQVLEAQREWREHLGCEPAETDSLGLNWVLVPPGLVPVVLVHGEEPEWIECEAPFWLTRGAIEARVLRGLFQRAADHGVARFAQLLSTTAFLKRSGEGFGLSAEDLLALCDFLSQRHAARYRLPSELEWLAGVDLFQQPATGSLRASCLGVESSVGGLEWTGTSFGPLRARMWRSSVAFGLRTSLVLRSAGIGLRRNGGFATPMTVSGARLVKEINREAGFRA